MKKPAEYVFTPAVPSDVPSIAALLRSAGLPHEDFESHLSSFLVARRDNRIVGTVGAELYGPDALLRSLVVATEYRGDGVGDELVRRLENTAEAWGVRRWWLLTTTAELFFKKHGFKVTARTEAPAAIAATTQFRGLCPSVAACLSRERRST